MQRKVPNYLPKASADQLLLGPKAGANRAISVIVRSIICISFFFMIFPAFDLTVSRWFADGSVFVLAEQPVLLGLRQIGLKGSDLIAGTMLLLLGLHILLPRRGTICAPHKPLFVLLSFVASQLLVEVLKVLIGRARPRHLLEFGGHAEFTPVWQFSAACARNCSLPSGEAAAAAAAFSLLVFVPARRRWNATILMAPVLMLIAFNRVLFGAHFLSDVILGWMLTMLVMALIWKWMEPSSKEIDLFFTSIRPSGRVQHTAVGNRSRDRATVAQTACHPRHEDAKR